MPYVNLTKNLFFPIILIISFFFFIISTTSAQELPLEAQVQLLSVHDYKNIPPVYYEYYNIPGLNPLLTKVFLILSASLAILGGFFVAGTAEWMQHKISERRGFRFREVYPIQSFANSPRKELDEASSYGVKFK